MKFSSRIVDVNGVDASEYYLDFPKEALRRISSEEFSQGIFNKAYIFHVFMKSEEDALRRLERGMGGDFNKQNSWNDMLNKSLDEFKMLLKNHSVTEDLSLQRAWENILNKDITS